MKTRRILGIDLGGCMSGTSAYLYANISADGIEIVDAFKEPRHKDHGACLEFLEAACRRHNVEAIAIDAPLSLPGALIDPQMSQLPREGYGEILNPWLYRYTDYHLYHRYGLRPMPPAGDRIGRLTARAVALLQRLEYDLPFVTLGERRLPLFEVYPKQIAHTLGVPDYKRDPEAIFEALGSRIDGDAHLVDALLCAYGGYRVLGGHTEPPPESVRHEGWCFPVL
jgi:predicted nuclease with RNAse H fold